MTGGFSMFRHLVVLTATLMLCTSSPWTIRSAQAAESQKPNIVFILSDDHRWDFLGCAGHPFIKTPNLDRLAGEGIRFKNALPVT